MADPPSGMFGSLFKHPSDRNSEGFHVHYLNIHKTFKWLNEDPTPVWSVTSFLNHRSSDFMRHIKGRLHCQLTQRSKQNLSYLSPKPGQMGNRKLSHVPLRADNHLDNMSSAIRTRSYHALVAQGTMMNGTPPNHRPMTQSNASLALPPDALAGRISAAPAPCVFRATSSPLMSAEHYPNGYNTPVISPVLRRTSSGLPLPMSSQSLSASLFNQHINPAIFDTPIRSQSSLVLDTAGTDLLTEGPLLDDELGSPSKRLAVNGPARTENDLNDDDGVLVDLPRDIFDAPRGSQAVDLAPPAVFDLTPQSQGAPSLLFLPNEERLFNVYFNLWQAQCPEDDPVAGKKRKRTPGGTRPVKQKVTKPKYSNYASKIPTKFTIKPKHCSFQAFKQAMFSSCDERLPGVLEVFHRAWATRSISLLVFVNGSPNHKATDKQTISTPQSFQSFVHAALSASASTTMGCRIVHEDPRKTAHAMRSILSAPKPSDNKSEESDGNETDGSVGVSVPLLFRL
ncbi:uncharacterized protein MELLADRAFT_88471 [Melampsora larici-populina 98AG31]|uniref:Uncharacterized protein n=1 Tax=Melampsora larici-populina (strain 98AG31 / pathotype 3-4-7) TaxID=747676 RepID=F4RRU5_MELLP|nr:uncharacterized protein MELLADRAFT_88471 [Melampsora larici-populina 98AG31]EGG04742.1 hypothetical protein MELLADRAFT_88471 [Melampsora larici-populina 98AG31]